MFGEDERTETPRVRCVRIQDFGHFLYLKLGAPTKSLVGYVILYVCGLVTGVCWGQQRWTCLTNVKVEPPKLQLQHLKSIGFDPTSFYQAKEMLVLQVCWIAREKRKKQKEYHGKN